MRICMIVSASMPPQEGIGFYAWNLSQQLRRQGHSVQIITRGKAEQTSCEVVDGIPIWRPPFVPAYPFHVHLHGFWVDRLVQKLEPDVDLFHLHTPLVKRPRTRRPILVTVHTPMKADTATVSTDNLLGWLIKLQAPVSYRLEQDLFDGSGKLTAVSNSVAAELKDYGVDKTCVGVLGNGVNVDQFAPEERSDSFYALTVARLAPRKGLADLIQCAEHVVKKVPDFRFLIAGSGPMEQELRAEIEKRRLDQNVVLLGHIADRAKLVELYQRATVFVHPAHYEGLPTVLLEAMACGLPVVATAVSGTLDVVQHEENGLLVPPYHPEKMGQAILQMIKAPQLAKCLGMAARKTVEAQYSWQTICKKYVAEYETLLTEG